MHPNLLLISVLGRCSVTPSVADHIYKYLSILVVAFHPRILDRGIQNQRRVRLDTVPLFFPG